jgi:hypothetical protein
MLTLSGMTLPYCPNWLALLPISGVHCTSYFFWILAAAFTFFQASEARPLVGARGESNTPLPQWPRAGPEDILGSSLSRHP